MRNTGVAYFDSRLPRHVRADLDDMLAHGCSYVIHCLSESDVLFYRKSMAMVVAETHSRGMEVWMDPWGVGNLYGGEPHRSGFVGMHPEACQVRADGAHVDRACPNQPLTRAFVRDWLAVAAEIGTDVVFWDEPHYYPSNHLGTPHLWTCRCPVCQDLFHGRFGHAMPMERTAEVIAFRERSLIDLLTESCAEARKLGMQNALCPLPFTNGDSTFRDWEPLAAIPALDIFGTDPYWISHTTDAAGFVQQPALDVLGLCRRHNLADHVWVQAFEVPAGREAEVGAAIDAIAAAGATNIAVWGYLGCAGMSSAACGNPELVWEIIGEAFRRYRGATSA